jgi:flagellar basal-body rod modification protein FlgD
MATATPVNPNYYAAEAYNTKTRTPTSELGKDEFLQILAVQLSNQDPLEPVQDTEFIAQMAQFSSLEQMQAMADSTIVTQSYSMIGRDVYGEVTDSAGQQQQIIGRVVGTSSLNGSPAVIIGDYVVSMSSIKQVYDSGVATDSLMAQAVGLIGKHVTAEIPTGATDENNRTVYEKVEGDVDYVLNKNGILYAKLKDTSAVEATGDTPAVAAAEGREVMIAHIIKVV